VTLLYRRGRPRREEEVIRLLPEDLRDWTARLGRQRERGAIERALAAEIGRRNPGRDRCDLVIRSRNFR
jgi:hypothetical protein